MKNVMLKRVKSMIIWIIELAKDFFGEKTKNMLVDWAMYNKFLFDSP